MVVENDLLADELIRSVELLAETFDSRAIPYAMIGGLAASMRGRPRFTQDVDVLLDVPQLALPGLMEELSRVGFVFDMPTVMREYLHEHMTSFHFGSVRIDWLKPVLPLYARAIADASLVVWTERHFLRVASVEGLILTKLVASRPQDQIDIEALFMANPDQIDCDLIRREWSAIADENDPRTVWLENTISRLASHRP